MKIFIFGTRGFPDIQGGVEKHCEALYTRLSDTFSITIFRRKPYIKSTPHCIHIQFIDLPSTRIKGFEAAFHSLLCTFICIWKRPDIIHVHNIGPGCFIPLLRLVGLKTVLTYHSANYEHKKWGYLSKKILKLSEFFALSFANKIIFVNSFQLEKQSITIKKKSTYIPNGINDNLQRTNETSYIKTLNLFPKKYILAVGRITPEKGFDDLIEAFTILNDPNYKLVIAGGVEHEINYFNFLKSKNHTEKIIFTGFITEKHLQELYTHSALFVLSSHNEGFPLVVLEAMQLGCNILLSDIPATRLLNLPDSYYYPVGDIKKLFKCIKSKLETKYTSNHQYNLSKYNWDSICLQTSQIYKSLVRKTI